MLNDNGFFNIKVYILIMSPNCKRDMAQDSNQQRILCFLGKYFFNQSYPDSLATDREQLLRQGLENGNGK